MKGYRFLDKLGMTDAHVVFYMNRRKIGPRLTDDPAVNEEILQFTAKWNVPKFSGDFAEMIASLYRLSQQDPGSSDMVLFKRSLAELRYAQGVFAPYRGVKKICIFGSARIRPPSKIYSSATEFARLMTEAGYMTITGAGDGIMGAAQQSAGAEKSFGLNMLLPFEQYPNEVMRDDPNLSSFRFSFTLELT